ncbi:MAG: hypothetical protein IT184_16460 [Acidobacteria bacterium]|nr:hypothetical protein [Acidobacteriota bacterium]
MTFDVEIDGRVRVVSIEPVEGAGPAGGVFRVRVQEAGAAPAGEPREVEMRATDLGVCIVHRETGRCVDAALTPRPDGEWLIQLPHVSVAAVVDGRRLRRGAVGSAGGSGEQRLVSPMPGRVVRVLVRPGDRVEPRQGVVVIEAMKMENELVAARGGTVVEVAVADGMSVEAGRLLVRID